MNPEAKAVGPSPVSDRATRLTRGYGRGNLPQLLRYWRRQCKRPGCFRRCVRKLRDEPGIIQPPHRLCAWIVYQVHGHWPGSRAHRAGKSFENFVQKKTLRDINSAALQPLNGCRDLLDYKAAMFAKTHSADDLLDLAWGIIANAGFREGEDKTPGWYEAARRWRDNYHEYIGVGDSKDLVPNSVQTVASTLLPGETRPWREAHPRRIGYSLLFGGGPGGRGGLGGNIGRRIGGSARNPYRCPAGFEGGGRFTNRSLSTCGTQVLALPGGNIPAEARRAAERAIRQTRNEEGGGGAVPRTAVEISEVHQNQLRKLRGAVPPDVGRASGGGQRSAINKTMGQLAKATGRDALLQRVVRRDGVVLAPLVSVGKLANLRNSDDLQGAAYLTKFNKVSSTTGIDEIGLFGAGIREIHFSLPGNMRVVASTGKKVSPRDVAALKGRASTLSRGSHPLGGIVGLAEESNLFKLSASAPKISEPNRKVRVQTEKGISRVVPRWVFLTFLSKDAPLRSSSEPVYSLVEEVGGPSAKQANDTYIRIEQKVLAFNERVQ